MTSPQVSASDTSKKCEVENLEIQEQTAVIPFVDVDNCSSDDLERSTNIAEAQVLLNSSVSSISVNSSNSCELNSQSAVVGHTVIAENVFAGSSVDRPSETLVPLVTEATTSQASTAVISMNPHRDNTGHSSNGRISPFPGLNFTRQFIMDRNRHYSSEARSFRENLTNVIQDFQNPGRLGMWIPNSQHFGFRVAGGGNSAANTTAHSNNAQHSDSFVINVDDTPHNIPPSAILTEISAQNASLRRSNAELAERQHRLASMESGMNEAGASSTTTTHQHHFERQNSTSSTNNTTNNNNGDGGAGGDGGVQDTLSQMPEARALLNTIGRYMPYMFILLAKACYDHMDGILDFFAFFITFSHANWVVRQEISKQQQRRFLPLLRELFYIFTVIIIIGYMFERKNLFISLVFASSFDNPFTLKHLLFSVAITDLVLKLLTVAIKILITMLPPSIVDYKGRGRIFLMTEAISQLYRALAPIQPWLVFLLDSYEGTEKIMGVILSAAYMVAKGSDLLTRAKFCKRSFVKLLQKVSFGNQPTKEQMQTAGGVCPICHDSYNSPVLLECSHIFCELCVGTWFDREQTCPLCRARVVDDPAYRDGSTTFFLQLY